MPADEAAIKRILPHSADAEKAVIGAMLMNAEAIAAASEEITGEDFYQRQYGQIFDAIVALYNEGKPVDVLTLTERLQQSNLPAEYTSVAFFTELIGSVPFYSLK